MRFFLLSPSWVLLLNLVAASLVISVTAIVAARVVRRRAVSIRHGLLCIALILMLASPFPIWIFSSLGFGFVKVAFTSEDRAIVNDSDSATSKRSRDMLAPMPESAAELPEKRLTVAHLGVAPGLGSVTGPNNRASADWALARFGVLFLIVWTAVSVYLSVRLVRGLYVIRRFGRSIRSTVNPRLIAAVNRVPSLSTVRVLVVESSLAPAPLTLGWWRSTILIPEGLVALLDDEELDCVLTHEAAHAVRHDTAIALLQQLAAIGFWWNPMLRAMNRQINQLRERICDAYVVQQLGDGLPLARSLVRVAEWSSNRGLRLSLVSEFLDDEDDLAHRVSRLAAGEPSATIGLNRLSKALLASFGVLLGFISVIPVVRAQTAAAQPPAATATKPAASVAQDEPDGRLAKSELELGAESAPLPPRIHGVVVDATEKSVAGARVTVLLRRFSEVGDEESTGAGPWSAVTDAQGRYSLAPTGTIRPTRDEVRIKVVAEGFADVSTFAEAKELLGGSLPQVEMVGGRRITGQLVDQGGKPVTNAIVRFQSCNADLTIAWDSGPFPVDRNGRFSVSIPADGKAAAAIYPAAFAPRLFNVTADADQGRIVLEKGIAPKGRVVDRNGQGVAKAVVGIRNTEQRLLFAYLTLIGVAVRSDEAGYFQLPPLRGKYVLSVVKSAPDYSRQMMLVGSLPPPIEPVTIDTADSDELIVLRAEH